MSSLEIDHIQVVSHEMIKEMGKMFHRSNRQVIKNNMPVEQEQNVNNLLDEFIAVVQDITQERRLRRATVRSQLICNLILIIDSKNVLVIAEPHGGMPTSHYRYLPTFQISSQEIFNIARWDYGYSQDPFLISFPISLIDQDKQQRSNILYAIAQSHIESEYQRVVSMTQIIRINPLFGPASHRVDEKLAFILMPFKEDLTKTYVSIIKPTVESTGLVCRRADEFKTNKVIMQDIWKAICEARIVIADLTYLNPNVFYELGIAHTVGKETILIYQKKEGLEIKFPFDLSHIRRIEYEDNATGGKKLEIDLLETIKSILEPVVL